MRKSSGFTLIELLIASVIILVLFGVLFEAWESCQGSREVYINSYFEYEPEVYTLNGHRRVRYRRYSVRYHNGRQLRRSFVGRVSVKPRGLRQMRVGSRSVYRSSVPNRRQRTTFSKMRSRYRSAYRSSGSRYRSRGSRSSYRRSSSRYRSGGRSSYRGGKW